MISPTTKVLQAINVCFFYFFHPRVDAKLSLARVALIPMIWSLDVESAAPGRAETVHFQSKLAIRPTMFFLLNNEPRLMPVLLLGSFWLFEIPSCWVRSLISHAFVARFGEWKKSKWFDFFCSTLGFLCKTFILPPIPSFLQSPLPSSSCCAFFCPFSFQIARQ